MPWTAEELRVFLSEHLLQDNLDAVVAELQLMEAGRGMVESDHPEPLLQGDVFDGVPWVRRRTQELFISPQRVLLVSNSCDASPENPRPIPLDITVAPVLRLSRYREMLADSGANEQRIGDIVSAIKRQEKTNLFYLPAGGRLPEEMIVLLDQVQSLPASKFDEARPHRLSVLTQRGFWMLLVKLSMHFLRPHEGVERQAA